MCRYPVDDRATTFYLQTEALKAIDCRPTSPTTRYAAALPPPQRPSHAQHQPRTQRPHRPSQPLPCPLPVPFQSPAARMILARNPASRLATSRTEFPAHHPAERPRRVCRSCGDYGDALRRIYGDDLGAAGDDAASGGDSAQAAPQLQPDSPELQDELGRRFHRLTAGQLHCMLARASCAGCQVSFSRLVVVVAECISPHRCVCR